jgi:hypothetical protein
VAELGRLTLRQWHRVNQILERHATCDRCHLFSWCTSNNSRIAAGVRGCDRYRRADGVAPPLDEDAQTELAAQLRELATRVRRAERDARGLFSAAAHRRHNIQVKPELLDAAQALGELATTVANINLADPWRARWREYVIEVGNRVLRVGSVLSKEAQWQRLHGGRPSR